MLSGLFFQGDQLGSLTAYRLLFTPLWWYSTTGAANFIFFLFFKAFYLPWIIVIIWDPGWVGWGSLLTSQRCCPKEKYGINGWGTQGCTLRLFSGYLGESERLPLLRGESTRHGNQWQGYISFLFYEMQQLWSLISVIAVTGQSETVIIVPEYLMRVG